MEENKANVSDTINTMNVLSNKYIGNPLSWLFPPGTVIEAANTTVAIRVATNIQEFDVSFIQFFASSSKGLCSSLNNCQGVLPSLALTSL